MSDVNHPKHYNVGKIEVIEFIEDQGFGPGFWRGNALKYAVRAGKKNPAKTIEDLEKAVWYLNREIEILRAREEERTPLRPNAMNPRELTRSYDCVTRPPEPCGCPDRRHDGETRDGSVPEDPLALSTPIKPKPSRWDLQSIERPRSEPSLGGIHPLNCECEPCQGKR